MIRTLHLGDLHFMSGFVFGEADSDILAAVMDNRLSHAVHCARGREDCRMRHEA